MFDCTTDSYDSLYTRWLETPGGLLDCAKYDPKRHRSLLDLCGGTGAVANEALRRGAAKVWLLDLNPRTSDPRVVTSRGRAEDLKVFGTKFDFVVCRQALGYLDLPRTAAALFHAMTPDAPFVCNAFVKPKWSLKPYRYKDRWYLEASGYFGRKVFHLQATDGDFDVTVFRWHSIDDILTAFAPYFEVGQFIKTEASLKFVFRRR